MISTSIQVATVYVLHCESNSLRVLVRAGHISQLLCDKIVQQYFHFIDFVVSKQPAEFRNFNSARDHVDSLLHKTMGSDISYKELWGVVKKLLLLSHGQATVERGF